MLDPDETLRYLDFFDSRAVEGEDEPPRDAASTALAAAPHALPSRTAPALEVSASKMDDGLPSPTAAELEDERVRDAVALLGLVIAADPRESKQARKRARRAMRAASAELLVLPAWLLTPKSPPKARPEIAPVKMPKIAPVDYAAILDREQAAFDAAEFTPATADPDAPPPDMYISFGSTRNPLVVQLRNLRRRSWLSRVRGERWTGTDDVDLVRTYNNARNAGQERRRRAAQTAPCVYDRYARVPISAPS